MRSIKTKLIAFGITPLVASFAIVLVVFIVALNTVVDRFASLGEERSAVLSRQIRENSARSREKMVGYIEESLRRKGTNLVQKDALALTQSYLENAYLGVRDFLGKTLSFDDEIVEASFFTVTADDGGEIKAWQLVSREYENGFGLKVTYDVAKKAWVTETMDGVRTLPDDRIPEIIKTNEPALTPIDYELHESGKPARRIKALDATIPIVDPAFGDAASALKAGKSVAFLRYILTSEKMQLAVQAEEEQLKNALTAQQEERQNALRQSESIKGSVKAWTLTILFLIAALILAGALAASIWASRKLTKPILSLTEGAKRIASGDFDTAMTAESNDEIGGLSVSFDRMRVHVKDYQNRLLTILSSTRALAACRQVAEAVGTAAGYMGQSHLFRVGQLDTDMFLFCDDQGRLGTVTRESLRDVKRAVYTAGGVKAADPRYRTLEEGIDEEAVRASLDSSKPRLVPGGSLMVPVSTGRKHYGYLRFTPYVHTELHAEDADFVQAIASALAIALDNIAFLREQEERVRVESEMEAARVLQHSLLPGDIVFPGVDLAYQYQAAAQTGGDWLGCQYDRINHRLELCIGDVTGHGFPSALLTGVVCGAIYSGSHLFNLLEGQTTPAERLIAIARVANRIVYDTGRRKQMMTMIFMSLCLDTGELYYMNAGHNPFFQLKSKEETPECFLDAFGILGFSEDPGYKVNKIKLEPGDSVFMHTDGLVENTGPNERDVLNFRRLKKALSFNRASRDVLDDIMAAANKVWQGHTPADDVTALVFRWNGSVSRQQVEDMMGQDSLHNLVAVSRGLHDTIGTQGQVSKVA